MAFLNELKEVSRRRLKEQKDQEIIADWDVGLQERQTEDRTLKLRSGLEVRVSPGKGKVGTGRVVWQGAACLVRFLDDRVKMLGLKGAKVLELGCGVGFVGICVACLGARVCLSDMEELIPFAKANIEKNQTAIAEGKGVAEAKVLKWGETSLEDFGDYDLIIASEVIYTKEGVQALIETVKELFEMKGDKLRGIFSWRDAGRVGLKTFIQFLERHFKEMVIHSCYNNVIRICEFSKPVRSDVQMEEKELNVVGNE